jgi:CelD/BcsL family acetyltransferase involved in cellulose biosynthesis
MQTNTVEPPKPEPGPLADAAAGPLKLTVLDTLAAAEPYWRELEARAVLTPYQRFDWLAPLLAVHAPAGARLAIAVIHAGAAPIALLPLLIRRHAGVAVATLLGADLDGIGWMPVDPAAARLLTPAALQDLFLELRRQAAPLDLIVLHSQPRSWRGQDNPLLGFPHQPGPDHLYKGVLPADPGTKRLRNIQRGKRRLEEGFGPVVLRHADTPEEIDRVHAEFLVQRGKRFAEQGIANVFATDWVVAFFHAAARRGLGDAHPALRLHALYAGDQIVATSCGAYGGGHYSQYINSTTDGPAAKSSLMGLLVHQLTVELAADGIASIDMGLGDFDYKTDWTTAETVYDVVVPLTARGRLLAPLLRGWRRLKRAIKQNPRLFGLLRRARALILRRPRTEDRTAS